MTTPLKDINDANFEQEVGPSSPLTLVDFFAEWCGPCKQLSPLIHEIAEEYAGRVTVSKVDIDRNPALRDRFAIRGVPTLLLFKDGQEVSRTHFMTKSRLAAILDTHLNGSSG